MPVEPVWMCVVGLRVPLVDADAAVPKWCASRSFRYVSSSFHCGLGSFVRSALLSSSFVKPYRENLLVSDMRHYVESVAISACSIT